MKLEQSTLMDAGLLWIRVLTGCGMAYHGYGKIFLKGLDGFTQGVAAMGFPFPAFFAWGAALSEFLGGICLALGFFPNIAAFFIFSTMTVAAFVAHASDPFKAKELALAYWAVSGMLILTGGGRFSLSNLFRK